ncbi:alkaline phosphatase family protein [Pelomyxa schiedti]|nr:alkaline phosphatase family protein [Pelomyxa schiedti]
MLHPSFVNPVYGEGGFYGIPRLVESSFSSRDVVVVMWLDALSWRFIAPQDYDSTHPTTSTTSTTTSLSPPPSGPTATVLPVTGTQATTPSHRVDAAAEIVRRQFDTIKRGTSLWPSTTACCVACLDTGLPPCRSEMLEWRFYDPVLDDIVLPLRYTMFRMPRGPIPKNAAEHLFAKCAQSTVYSRLRSRGISSCIYASALESDSPYAKMVRNCDRVFQYQDLTTGLASLSGDVANARVQAETTGKKSYFFYYYGAIDKLSHQFGPSSPQVAAEVEKVFQTVESEFIQPLSTHSAKGRILLIVCADHGQVDISPETIIHLNTAFPDIVPLIKTNSAGLPIVPNGSKRDLFLYVKEGCAPQAISILSRGLSGRCDVVPVRYLVQNNYFGPVSAEEVDQITSNVEKYLGQVAVLPYTGESVWWDYGTAEPDHPERGSHGGNKLPFFLEKTKFMSGSENDDGENYEQEPSRQSVTTYQSLCRYQFEALLASSVPRCGARSPARVVASFPPLMHAMWRDFIMGPTNCFILVLMEQQDHYGEWFTVSFGVSPIMVGVTHAPAVIRGPEDYDFQWLRPGVCLLHKADKELFSTSLYLTTSMNDHEEIVRVASNLTFSHHGANGKWLVVCELFSAVEQRVTVTDIQQRVQVRNQEQWAAPVVALLRAGGCQGAYQVVMNPANVDEALLWGVLGDVTHFALLDVSQTHSTKTLVVLSSTQCAFPPRRVCDGEAIIMRRSSGEVLYVVQVSQFGGYGGLLFLVESATGTTTKIPEALALSQVSASLFCVCSGFTYQLWDCNDTAHPLRTLCITGDGDFSSIKQVVGGSGFLFVLRYGNKVTVLEALSGITVLTFDLEKYPVVGQTQEPQVPIETKRRRVSQLPSATNDAKTYEAQPRPPPSMDVVLPLDVLAIIAKLLVLPPFGSASSSSSTSTSASGSVSASLAPGDAPACVLGYEPASLAWLPPAPLIPGCASDFNLQIAILQRNLMVAGNLQPIQLSKPQPKPQAHPHTEPAVKPPWKRQPATPCASLMSFALCSRTCLAACQRASIVFAGRALLNTYAPPCSLTYRVKAGAGRGQAREIPHPMLSELDALAAFIQATRDKISWEYDLAHSSLLPMAENEDDLRLKEAKLSPSFRSTIRMIRYRTSSKYKRTGPDDCVTTWFYHSSIWFPSALPGSIATGYTNVFLYFSGTLKEDSSRNSTISNMDVGFCTTKSSSPSALPLAPINPPPPTRQPDKRPEVRLPKPWKKLAQWDGENGGWVAWYDDEEDDEDEDEDEDEEREVGAHRFCKLVGSPVYSVKRAERMLNPITKWAGCGNLLRSESGSTPTSEGSD